MSPPELDFLNVFISSPGNFLFFLLIIFLTQASLFISFDRRGVLPDDRTMRTYSIALAGVATAWVLLVLAAVFSLVTGQSPDLLLPPLEHGASLVSLVLLGWAFLSADHDHLIRSRNFIAAILCIAVIIGYMTTGIQWAQIGATVQFLNDGPGMTWIVAGLLLSVLGVILGFLFIGRVVDTPLKILFFVLAAAGYIYTALQLSNGNMTGNVSGAVRLALVLGFAVVTVILYRRRVALLFEQVNSQQSRPVQAVQAAEPAPQRQVEVSPPQPASPTPRAAPVRQAAPPLPHHDTHSVQLMKALGQVLEAETTEQIPERIMITAIDMLRADVGALLRVQDANYADVALAFDKVMQRTPQGMSLNLEDQPSLLNVIERRTQRGLFVDRNGDELYDLYTRLDIDQIGPAYFQPLVYQGDVIGILLLAYPYSQRDLTASDVELLKAFGIVASNLLHLSHETEESIAQAQESTIQAIVEGRTDLDAVDATERAPVPENLKIAREQIDELNTRITSLKVQLDEERTRLSELLGGTEEGLSISQRISVINDEQESLRRERDQLAQRLQEAEAALSGVTATDDEAVVTGLIESLQVEKEQLLKEQQRLQEQLETMRSHTEGVMPEEIQQLLARMGDERSELETERDQLASRLNAIQSQLRSLGYETDEKGLAQFISRIFEERLALKKQLEIIQKDRDALLTERSRLGPIIQKEAERTERLQMLEAQLENLAHDREAAIKQRDKLRAERTELLEKIDRIKDHRARLLAETAGYDLELSESREEQARLRSQIQELADERSRLSSERDRILAENESLRMERDHWQAQEQGDPVRAREINEQGIGALRRMIDELSDERNALEIKLNEANVRLVQLEEELAARDSTIGGQPDMTYTPRQPELTVDLVQELRTPMTSISGYIDLLLSESSGILGEMQRKFLQRVSSNVQRLNLMMDDLIHITELDAGTYAINPQPVDMIGVIEDAITNAAVAFREKGLTLTLDLQEDLPRIPADKDALHQVVGQLMTNAYLASPADSEVVITAEQRAVRLPNNGAAPVDVIFVSVTDSGGGIPPEDIPRVFARKYRSENPLIRGLGDTGVGMSIARALVDAHGGHLWVETEHGQGSSFQFVIPISSVENER